MNRNDISPGEISQNPAPRPARRWLTAKRIVIVSAILICVVLMAFMINPSRWYIFGIFNGDRFFSGWPTRYWAERLTQRETHSIATDRLVRGGQEAVGVLAELLGNPNPTVREGAATALARLAPNTEQAIPALAVALTDQDRAVRVAAIPAGLASKNAMVLRHLLSLAESLTMPPSGEPDPEQARLAAKLAAALGRFGPEAISAVRKIETWLPISHSRHADEVEKILSALQAIDPSVSERLIPPDEWWSGFGRMEFVGTGGALAGIRRGDLYLIKNGKWEKQSKPEIKGFASASSEERRLIALAHGLSASTDGTLLAAAREVGSGAALLIDGKSGEPRAETFRPPDGVVFAQEFSPAGRELALGVKIGEFPKPVRFEIVFVDVDKKELRTQISTPIWPRFVAYSQDGAKIAVASDLGRGVDVFDTATGKHIAQIPTEWTQIRPVFCNQSKWVTTLTGTRNAISVWDAATGKLVRELKWHRGADISAVAVSPDGNRLATCDSHGWIRTWDLSALE